MYLDELRPRLHEGVELATGHHIKVEINHVDVQLPDFLTNEGYIELEALVYIRGRSIPGQWVIIDEAQNLSRENIKTIITRVGKGTKIVITGDIQQIDNCRLTATSNGFVTLIEAFKGQNLYAHVTLSKTERSSLAALGVKLL